MSENLSGTVRPHLKWGTAGMTDLQALAEARDAAGNLIFDTNGDGVLNASDTAWSELQVWQDLDQDGVTDAGELMTLESLGKDFLTSTISLTPLQFERNTVTF